MKLPDEIPFGEEESAHIQKELRFWYKVALCVLPLAVVAAFAGRRAIQFALTLDKGVLNFSMQDAFSKDGIFISSMVIILPIVGIVWTKTIEKSVGRQYLRRTPLAVIFSLIVVITVGIGASYPRFTWALTEAVKTRAAPFTFARSVAFWKSENLRIAPLFDEAGLVLVGSSQMNFAVDGPRLATLLSGFQIRKKCLPGFGILQYIMVVPEILQPRPQIVVCWLSEFDTFREDRLPVNRLRYFAHADGIVAFCQAFGWRESWRNRAELFDLAFGVALPTWRDRDLIGLVIKDFWWPAKVGKGKKKEQFVNFSEDEIQSQREVFRRSIRRTQLIGANFNAFGRFAKILKGHGVDLYVFEGSTNPLATTGYDASFRKETRTEMTKLADEVGFTYIPASKMPEFSENDFVDFYHLNPESRERFTVFLADFIKSNYALPLSANL